MADDIHVLVSKWDKLLLYGRVTDNYLIDNHYRSLENPNRPSFSASWTATEESIMRAVRESERATLVDQTRLEERLEEAFRFHNTLRR
jgi:hypothetical protein